VLIRIARAARLTLLNSEIQTLKPGEIYEVAPAVGRVLIGDGWAAEVVADRREPWDESGITDNDPFDDISGS
jgi:hypothetical protein